MDKTKLETVIEKAQNLLKFFTEKQSEKFTGVKVVDSDVLIDYADLQIGSEVQISTSTGSEPAPDGDYKLVNGVEFTVKDGKISAIASTGDAEDAADANDPKEGEQMAEQPEVQPDTDGDAAEDEAETQALNDLTQRVGALEDAMNQILQAIGAVPSKEDMTAFSAELKTVTESIEALAKVPTQFSADKRVEVQISELDIYKRLADSYSK